MASTLHTLRKTIQRGLHERALHYLWDTGTVREILDFSKDNTGSVKVQQVIQYLYSYLGICLSPPNTKARVHSNSKKFANGKKRNVSRFTVPINNSYQNPGDVRIFEIKKLIEAVAHEIAFLSTLVEENNNSTQYSWKMSRYHMEPVKKQKMACCSYTSCLFNNRKHIQGKTQQAGRKNIKKTEGTTKIETRKDVRRYRPVERVSVPALRRRTNVSKNVVSSKKMQPKQLNLKSMVEIATQTPSWKQDTEYSSSYLDTLKRACDNHEYDSSNSVEEFYCKSDTLNDASMITEEIASEFAVDHLRNKFETDSKIMNTVGTESKELGKSITRSNHNFQRDMKFQTEAPRRSIDCKYATGKQKSFSSGNGMVRNQLSLKTPTSRSPNISTRSKTSKSDFNSQHLTDGQSKKVDAPQNSSSKHKSSVKENHIKPSPTTSLEKCGDLTAKSKTESKLNGHTDSTDKLLDSKKETPKSEVDVSLDSTELQNEIDIVKTISKIFNKFEENGVDEPLGNCLPIASSSENETTYLPAFSASSSGSCSVVEDNSSIKENDNTSPEYSSHWTEESSSSEVSESELDVSFQKKFITYKRSLLEEDDGIAASSEGETISSQEKQTTEDLPNLCNDVAFITYEMLSEAIFMGKIEEFRKLLPEANIHQTVDENGWNLLHLAVSKGLDCILEELLNLGVSIESMTKDGYTPLKLAVTNNHLKCCKVLLQSGASIIKEDGTLDKEILEKANQSSPMKRLFLKYEDNLKKLRMISEVLNQFGKKKESVSTLLSKNLLKSLADLTLEEDEDDENMRSSISSEE